MGKAYLAAIRAVVLHMLTSGCLLCISILDAKWPVPHSSLELKGELLCEGKRLGILSVWMAIKALNFDAIARG